MSELTNNPDETAILNGIEAATVDAEIKALQDQLVTMDATIALAEIDANAADYEQIQKAEEEIQRIRQEAEESIKKIRFAIQESKDKAFDARRKLRDEQARRDAIKRQIEQAERVKLAQQKFEMLATKWDKLIAGAPWREWAMDHQLVAAKKIATQRKLILADTMGLGKTLSVFMACDLIEAATNEASEENPVDY